MITALLAVWLEAELSLPPLFVQRVPDSPDAVVALFQGPGDPPGLEGWRSTSLQVRVRAAGEDPRPPLAHLNAIYSLLHGAENVNLGGPVLNTCVAVQDDAIPLGQDSKGRHEWTQNYLLSWRPGP